MNKPTFDPGLTQKFTHSLRRAIRPDGSFNVVRRGTNWRDIHPYLYLINVSWTTFFGIILGAFFVLNLLFAIAYMLIGIEHLHGAESPSAYERFLNAFFFSSQSLTTGGYGSVYPFGIPPIAMAALEILVGLMGFVDATGLLVGRVCLPFDPIGFRKQ